MRCAYPPYIIDFTGMGKPTFSSVLSVRSVVKNEFQCGFGMLARSRRSGIDHRFGHGLRSAQRTLRQAIDFVGSAVRTECLSTESDPNDDQGRQ